MSDSPVRIAMWSGPRNISTAMMRSFEARGDAAVTDEPFYAAYLARTRIDHPLRDAVIASQSVDSGEVAAMLTGPVPGDKPIWYQKHMTLHLLEGFAQQWLGRVTNAFLIREADRLGNSPPVVDAADVLANPGSTLERLCAVLGVPYTTSMLHWLPGRRATDGVWAPAWYQTVERSTGFEASLRATPVLGAALRKLADEARPHYEALREYRVV